jgi:uncharacterized glyoxalase superfamily protein PhnB
MAAPVSCSAGLDPMARWHAPVLPSGVGQLLPCEAGRVLTMIRPNSGDSIVSNLTTVEIKAFVPARDFTLSKQFYQDLGFDLAWSDDQLAYMRHGTSSFLLQNFYNEVHAGNFMMHLLVADVDAWWHHVQAQGIPSKYDTKTEPPEDRPWGIRDFVLVDPTGVLWRIGQNISTSRETRTEQAP